MVANPNRLISIINKMVGKGTNLRGKKCKRERSSPVLTFNS